jgi:hypothetical protein
MYECSTNWGQLLVIAAVSGFGGLLGGVWIGFKLWKQAYVDLGRR